MRIHWAEAYQVWDLEAVCGTGELGGGFRGLNPIGAPIALDDDANAFALGA